MFRFKMKLHTFFRTVGPMTIPTYIIFLRFRNDYQEWVRENEQKHKSEHVICSSCGNHVTWMVPSHPVFLLKITESTKFTVNMWSMERMFCFI